MVTRLFAALALALAACASGGGASPFDNLAAMQQRLDDRGLGFGLTRVPGHSNAIAFQIRIRGAEADDEPPADPMEVARAAAPEGCTVASVTPAEDGLSFTAEYAC